MRRMIYISKAAGWLSRDDLELIMTSASANNLRDGIVGSLLYGAGTFIQVIEGGEAETMELFERINIDRRHFDVDLLIHEPIDQSVFNQWSMTYAADDHSMPCAPSDFEALGGINAAPALRDLIANRGSYVADFIYDVFDKIVGVPRFKPA
ncbi:MAG: BLUF domain-containing protein [Rhodospirillaceae bacterium]|nr:BLUF domain-containing protein [Rhodospirillaceae bacterium]